MITSGLYHGSHIDWCRGRDNECVRATTIWDNYNITGNLIHIHEQRKKSQRASNQLYYAYVASVDTRVKIPVREQREKLTIDQYCGNTTYNASQRYHVIHVHVIFPIQIFLRLSNLRTFTGGQTNKLISKYHIQPFDHAWTESISNMWF